MGSLKVNGNGTTSSDNEDEQPAVRDLPDPERQELTDEDIEILTRAGLFRIAEIGRRYVNT